MLKRLVVVVLALVCLGTQIVAQDTPNGDTCSVRPTAV